MAAKMRTWLYLIRHNRFGLQYLRKSYFVLEDNCLKSFKTIPNSEAEVPLRSAIIDSRIQVIDNGRESHHGKILFSFTICNTSNHKDRLKLGVTSSEEAARWIHSLQNAALVHDLPGKDLMSCSKRTLQPFSMSISKTMKSKKHLDWTSSPSSMASDVIAPSSWKIFGCQNGLRLFKEAKDRDSKGKHSDHHPAIMAVGVVKGSPEAVFHSIMTLDPVRAEWDFCFYRGSVVEHLDGHTDIIHIQLAMKRRDLLLRRYWRREDDGTYVILYHSVTHRKCPPLDGYVRACVKSGGYLITPIQQGKECVVKHMLSIDWKFWKSFMKKEAAKAVTIRMLGGVAALRELYRAKSEKEFASIESNTDVVLNLEGVSNTADEFFDAPESSDDEEIENDWHLSMSPELSRTITNQNCHLLSIS